MRRLYKGDRVKLLVGNIIWETMNGKTKFIEMMPEIVNRVGTVKYSYGDKYGTSCQMLYCIDVDDYGSIAWQHINQLKKINNDRR